MNVNAQRRIVETEVKCLFNWNLKVVHFKLYSSLDDESATQVATQATTSAQQSGNNSQNPLTTQSIQAPSDDRQQQQQGKQTVGPILNV